MNNQDKKKLAAMVRQVGKYKPAAALRMPDNPPPKKEMERRWRWEKNVQK